MTSETLPAKRLEHARTKLQDALSAIRLAQEELALLDSQMLGSDEHRRLIVAASAEKPIETADDIQSHRVQSAELADLAKEVAKAARSVSGKGKYLAEALGSVYQKELLDGDRAKEAKKDKQATIKWNDASVG